MELIVIISDVFPALISGNGKPVGGKDPVTLRKLQDFVVADWLAKTEI